jgi:hypothetical protein
MILYKPPAEEWRDWRHFCILRLRTSNSFQKFKIKSKKLKRTAINVLSWAYPMSEIAQVRLRKHIVKNFGKVWFKKAVVNSSKFSPHVCIYVLHEQTHPLSVTKSPCRSRKESVSISHSNHSKNTSPSSSWTNIIPLHLHLVSQQGILYVTF